MRIWALWMDESGANLVEYALLLVLIGIAMVTVIFPGIRNGIEGIFAEARKGLGAGG